MVPLGLILLGCVCAAHAEQEHKVHNIVLYPEKHSWCQTTPIQQVVASPGHASVTIQNNVCVGACFSYSIPKSEPAEPGELIRPYCDSCQPSQIECYHVNLKSDSSGDVVLQKRIEVITNCSCQSCDKVRSEDCAINDTNTMELPLHMYVDPENTNKTTDDYVHPDLFDAQNSHQQHFENDIKLKNKLKEWFKTYQKSENQNTDVDSFDPYLDIAKKNEEITNDLQAAPKAFASEPAASHQKGSHIGLGLHHPNDVVDHEASTHHHHHQHNGGAEHHPQHHHHHHHHLGEEQHLGLDVTHLVRGPHGSMVAAPQEIKLHIDSDSLKPNDEGLVVEYENHHAKDPPKLVTADGAMSE